LPETSYAPPATVPAQGSKPPVVGPVWTEVTVGAWWRRIQGSLDHTDAPLKVGKTNVERYQGKYLSDAPKTDQAVVPTDFYYIEQKKAQLFYQLPDVFLKPMQPGLEDAAIVFQAALNAKLGPAGVNVLPRIKEVLFDVLCPVGFGAVKVGFEAVIGDPPTVPVQVGEEPDFEAAMAPGSVLGLHIPMKPVMEDRPNIITTRYFVERIAPGDLLVPSEFAGSDFDDADFLGLRFREDLPDDDVDGGDSATDERRLVPLSPAAQSARRKQRTGYEIFYKASRFDKDVKHPDVIRVVTFYDDDKTTIPTPKLCPYQRYDGMTPAEAEGKIGQVRKVTGMPGFCIAPLTIRYVSDSWLAPSDCTMARNTADELSKGRTQMLTFRDRAMPQFGYDATRVHKDILAKLERNEMLAGIGFDGPLGPDMIGPIEKGRFGRENFEFNNVGQNDLDRIWGLGANQQSVVNQGTKTATELQLTQAASDDRMGSERGQVLGWHVHKIVPKFAALLQLFAEEEEFVELLGSDAQRLKQIPPEVAQQAQQTGQHPSVLVPWNKHLIQGRFAFTAKPDSQLRMDVAQYRESLMKAYQFLANEPTLNRQELTREVLKAFHFDFAKFTQPPPQKQAEPPGLSVSVKGEDLSPLSAQSPIVVEFLRHLGVPISAEALAKAAALGTLLAQAQAAAEGPNGAGSETAHGGAAAQQEPLSKHAASQTGGMQGSGQPAPIGPGGQL
jgi:hypothetical protein